MVEPRMLMVSREMGSRLRIVILTVRREVFIFTSTERIVPCRIVPVTHTHTPWSILCLSCLEASWGSKGRGRRRRRWRRRRCTILELNGDCFVLAFHEKPGWGEGSKVSLAFFCPPFFLCRREVRGRKVGNADGERGGRYLTSFMMGVYEGGNVW